jgi:hypothetical protein
MHKSIRLVWCLLALLSSGCALMDSNSRFNVNRGDYTDEFMVGKEGRSTQALEHEDMEGADKWLLSPKARAINRDLGVD